MIGETVYPDFFKCETDMPPVTHRGWGRTVNDTMTGVTQWWYYPEAAGFTPDRDSTPLFSWDITLSNIRKDASSIAFMETDSTIPKGKTFI